MIKKKIKRHDGAPDRFWEYRAAMAGKRPELNRKQSADRNPAPDGFVV